MSSTLVVEHVHDLLERAGAIERRREEAPLPGASALVQTEHRGEGPERTRGIVGEGPTGAVDRQEGVTALDLAIAEGALGDPRHDVGEVGVATNACPWAPFARTR